MNIFNKDAPMIMDSGPVSSETVMRAACYRQHGDESVIEITDRMKRPRITDNQVLIKVFAAGMNPVDVKLRENSLPVLFLPLPKIIGSDVCGVVIEVGKKASDKFRIGDRVMAMMPHVFSGWGAACEYAAVDENIVTRAPTNITAVEAASLPLISLTVLQSFESFVSQHRNATTGLSVLVQAGAGGLGSFAIQYCKHHLHMKVYTTCSANNADFCRSLGADVVIDYGTERFEDVALGMDVVFDPMAYMYEERTFKSKVLKNRGSTYIHIASSYHAPNPLYADPLHLGIPEASPHRIALGYTYSYARAGLSLLGLPFARYVYHFVHPDGEKLREVAQIIQNKEVRPIVSSENVFPLSQMAEANNKIRQGHVRGKVVITVTTEPER